MKNLKSLTHKKLLRGERRTVEIESLAIGGRGVGRIDGVVVFVEETAPGDVVEIEITSAKSNFAEGRWIKLVRASQHRVTPPCPVANRCGGCSWQHVSYPEQLRQKRRLIVETLKRIGGANDIESVVKDVRPSPKQWRYRNRVQLHHSRGQLGFFAKQSHEIINIDDCLITDERLTREFASLRARTLDLGPGRSEIFIVDHDGVNQANANTIGERSSGDAPFSQVNSAINQELIGWVLEIAQSLAHEGLNAMRVLELYAGSGNFSFALAQRLAQWQITAVELNADSVSKACNKIQRLGLSNLEFVQADALTFCRSLRPEFDLLILDPPRTGCDAALVDWINQSNIPNIVYISCHPATLARDLKSLIAQNYALTMAQPFDMFPQTDHVECLTHLRRE